MICLTSDFVSVNYWLTVFPSQHVAGKLERSSCSRYRLDLVLNLSAGEDSLHVDHVQNLSVLLAQVPSSDMMLEGCRDGWIYCKQYYQSTVVTEVLEYCWNTTSYNIQHGTIIKKTSVKYSYTQCQSLNFNLKIRERLSQTGLLYFISCVIFSKVLKQMYVQKYSGIRKNKSL